MNVYKVTLKSSIYNTLSTTPGQTEYYVAARSFAGAEDVAPNEPEEIVSIDCLGPLAGINSDE